MGKRFCSTWAFAVSTAVAQTAARAGTVIDRPTVNNDGLGINQYLWTMATGDLATAAGGSIQTSSNLSSLTPLLGSAGLWVDVGPPDSAGPTGLLSAAESATIAAYAATGRRVVLIGGGDAYGTWNSQLLNLVGGSYAGQVGQSLLVPYPNLPLTAGVTSSEAYGLSGTTYAGTTLFTVPLAVVAGPARNVLLLLSPTVLDDDTAHGSGGINTLIQNVTRWDAGGLPDPPCPWQAAAGGSWQGAAGWTSGNMPSAADEATFNLSAAYTVSVTGPVAVGTVRVVNDRVAFDLTGPGMTIATAVVVGQTTAGTLTLGRSTTGSAVATAGSVLVGPTGSLTVSAGVTLAVAGSVAGPVTVAAGGRFTAGTVADASLTIAGGTVALAAGGTDALASLAFAGTPAAPVGQLDLSTAALTIQNGDPSAVTALVRSGYAGGTFAGPGIVSSAAAADPAHLRAIGVSAVNGNVLVEVTTFGDADLNGVVDGRDYARIDAGFAQHLTGWANGDFNYDGVVDASDYTLIDNAFNRQGRLAPTAVVPTDEVAAVPEPSVAAVGVLALSTRCRRRRRIL